MDTAILREHLKQTERHVVTGAFWIASQRALISELEQNGFKELAARGSKLLDLFEELQAIHVDCLRRLRTKLAEPQPSPPI